MGYTISRKVVQRNLVQLEQLHEAQASLIFKTPHPKRLAHKLREAIHAASEFEEYEHLGELKHSYQFKVRRGHVVAMYEPPEGVILVEQASPSKGQALPPEKKTIPSAMSLMDVLTALLQFKDDPEITFPNAELSQEDKEKLFEWTKDKDWQYIDHEEAGVTLTKNEVPEEILWRPEAHAEN